MRILRAGAFFKNENCVFVTHQNNKKIKPHSFQDSFVYSKTSKIEIFIIEGSTSNKYFRNYVIKKFFFLKFPFI